MRMCELPLALWPDFWRKDRALTEKSVFESGEHPEKTELDGEEKRLSPALNEKRLNYF